MAEQKKTQSQSKNTQNKTTQNKSNQRKSTNANTQKQQQSGGRKAALQQATVKQKIRFDQFLVDSTPLFFGVYAALVSGLLAAGKYYMQSNLANEIFTSNSQDYIAYWIALSDIGFLVGVVALVVLPSISYYQRHGLRRLGKALVLGFVLVLIAVGILWYYIQSMPEPEPTPQFPQGLQQ